MKLTIKHIGSRPYQVREKNLGLVELSGGETFEGEFDDGEARAIAANTEMFEVSGYTATDKETGETVDGAELAHLAKFKQSVAPVAARLKIGDSAQFNDKVMAALDGLEKQVEDLTAENANLKAQVAKFDGDGNGKTGGSSTTNAQPVSLTDAVKSLDDKNDSHWTDGGKPDLAVLGTLTGGTVKRADVDAIGRTRVVS